VSHDEVTEESWVGVKKVGSSSIRVSNLSRLMGDMLSLLPRSSTRLCGFGRAAELTAADRRLVACLAWLSPFLVWSGSEGLSMPGCFGPGSATKRCQLPLQPRHRDHDSPTWAQSAVTVGHEPRQCAQPDQVWGGRLAVHCSSSFSSLEDFERIVTLSVTRK
jgi:hypothetical protein